MSAVLDAIEVKKHGGTLDDDAVAAVVAGYTAGDIPDYQMSALLMAIAIHGMSGEEMATLTQSMLRSGEQWNLRNEYDFITDKHSTGGVGDKVSLVLSPWVAA